MSWSFEHTGTKAGVIEAVTETLDKIATGYKGSAEGDDVLAVKARVIGIIGVLDLGPDGYTDWNGVTVKGNGSHSTTGKGIARADFTVSVERRALKL